jgi:hypothetical protein
MKPPVVATHAGIRVVRDDLLPGGTKARFIPALFARADEVAYASPAEGGAQTALAHVARALGKRATVFVAKRAERHPRTREAAALGARIVEVSPGYLSVVRKRAQEHCAATGALLAPFGMDLPEAVAAIAAAAHAAGEDPDEVWCAAGSGVLARALAEAWPRAQRHVVQVGRPLSAADVAGATIHVHKLPFGKQARQAPPFPSDPHYDAKAWETCNARHGAGRVLFWNVAGPSASVST